jgi:hypothetical protein
MLSRSVLWPSVFGLAVVLATPGRAHADWRQVGDVKEQDKTTPVQSWTPGQQWLPSRTNRPTMGYGSSAGMLVLADELGDKLSELGRASLIDRCFEYGKEDTTSSLMWALCGHDVKALDLKKAEAELTAEGATPEGTKEILDSVQEIKTRAQKIGDAVEAAAKDDPGVAAMLKLGDAARAEWTAYLGKNKDAFERYLTLKDAVRSGKSNHKSFAGCWEATQPAFAKLVKATKFPWEMSGDYMPGYMRAMVTTTENYIIAASFAACAYSVHESGEALVGAVMNQDRGGIVRVGWRSIALAKAMDPDFKPKFAERALSLANMRRSWETTSIKLEGVNEVAPIMTPAQGVVGSIKVDGDVAKISFKGDQVETCLQWKTTGRVQSVGAGGDVQYEKECKKRGMVDNQTTATEISAKFAAGIKPGVSVIIVFKFPVTAWKGKKFVSVFGVPVK